MQNLIRFIVGSGLAVFLCVYCISCEKPKEAKLEVTESEFFINKLSDYAYSVDARGKVRNAGITDVKRVVVTGYCKSCFKGMSPGHWTISERERAPEEIDVIHYLSAGAEEEFSFKDVAVMYNNVPEMPAEMPEQLDISIESYEVVD